LTTLAESDSSALYSTGRVSLWLVEPAVVYLILSFPSGRLSARTDRLLVASTLGIACLLYLPTAFLVETYPRISPLSGCVSGCPANFFMVADSTPGFVDPLTVVREILIMLVFVAVAVRLFRRLGNASRLTKRTYGPVLAAAVTRMGAYVAFLLTRRAAPDSAAVDIIGWVLLLTLPGIAIGFLVGLLRWRLHVATAMEKLMTKAMSRPSRAEFQGALAETLEDPSLEVGLWRRDRGVWIDLNGAPIDIESSASKRAVTGISDKGRKAVLLLHDPALNEHEAFVDAVGSVALFATENERLTEKLESSLEELRRSRVRILTAADRERHRIERDLHDGAQQQLVALRIKLELADDLVETDTTHAHELLRQAESEIEEALEQVRSLARGIYPSLLADQGLREALRAAALRVSLPTRVDCDGVTRYPAAIESAVYFTCLEALQNAVKHARGARGTAVSLLAGHDLRFEVRDDGEGFDLADVVLGKGITNMRDRIAAVGGRLDLRSVRGEGTVVSGSVPVGSSNGASLFSKNGHVEDRVHAVAPPDPLQ
jgi:signal transduction histidine kinase